MAFGDKLGTLAVGKASVTNPMVATGSVTVSVGDLIIAFGAELLNLTLASATDNLGNNYTAQNPGTDGGNTTGRMFYSVATSGGTLTAVSGVFTASTDDAAFVASVHSKGPNGFAVSPVDANPANLSADTTSPYTCPATGVLTQASELVICALAQGTVVQTISATAPNLLAVSQGSQAVGTTSAVSASIGFQVVSSTASVAPAFTAGGSITADTLHTISFKEAVASATAIFARTAAMAGLRPNASFPASVQTTASTLNTAHTPTLALLLNLLGKGVVSSKEKNTANYIGVLQLRSAAQDQGRVGGTFTSALSARSAAQSKELGTPSFLLNILGRGGSRAKARATALYTGVLAALPSAQSKGSATAKATTALFVRTMAQGKAAPLFKGLSVLASQAVLMSRGRAAAAYASALSTKAATISQARTTISAAASLLARGTAQSKAFGTVNFGIVALLARSAAAGMSRVLISAKTQLVVSSNSQEKAGSILLGVASLFTRNMTQSKTAPNASYVAGAFSRLSGISKERAATLYKGQLSAISNAQSKTTSLLSAVTVLLARGGSRTKSLGTINFGIIALAARSLAASTGKSVTTYVARLSGISLSANKSSDPLSATTSLSARSAAQNKTIGISNYLAGLLSRSTTKSTERAGASYKTALSAAASAISKTASLVSATAALASRSAAKSKALPSLVLVKALSALSAARSTSHAATIYVAQLGSASAAKLQASGVAAFAGQLTGFAQSVAISVGRGALILLPPILNPARLLISAGKTRLLLSYDETRLLVSVGKTRLLLSYGEARNRLISSLGKLRLLKR